jgi:hypothetical protein
MRAVLVLIVILAVAIVGVLFMTDFGHNITEWGLPR